jgi:hypothetical protein
MIQNSSPDILPQTLIAIDDVTRFGLHDEFLRRNFLTFCEYELVTAKFPATIGQFV